MVLFILSSDPTKNAQQLCDAEVATQSQAAVHVLSTVLWNTLDEETAQRLYKDRHITKPMDVNHAFVQWALECPGHYEWIADYGLAVAAEFCYRYQMPSFIQDVLRWLKCNRPPVSAFAYDAHTARRFVRLMPRFPRTHENLTYLRLLHAGLDTDRLCDAPLDRELLGWPDDHVQAYRAAYGYRYVSHGARMVWSHRVAPAWFGQFVCLVPHPMDSKTPRVFYEQLVLEQEAAAILMTGCKKRGRDGSADVTEFPRKRKRPRICQFPRHRNPTASRGTIVINT